MPVFEDKGLENIFNSLERVDINDVNLDDVRFIVYAGAGAMGSSGDFVILTNDLKVSENNYAFGILTKDDIIRFIPEFNKIDYRNYLGDKLNNYDTLNMGYGNYLLVSKSIAKEFYKNLSYYMTFKKDNYNPKELYLYWLYGALTTLKIHDKNLFIFKERKITKEDLMNLDEKDLLFITNPGRMGDEDGSTFVIKKDNRYIVYRVDGWMYPAKKEEDPISMDDMFKVFPKWKEAWKNQHKEDYNGKYVYIYTGFGNGLCVDKKIYDEYLPYLLEEIKNNGWDATIYLNEANPGVAESWQMALVRMVNRGR